VVGKFDNIGGLKRQAAVRSAGVVVGRVESITFDDKSFQARVTMALESRYQFPKDSSLKILTSGLLGEQYIGVEAGADEKLLAGWRYHWFHAVCRGAGKSDQPVPLQQGGRRRHCGTRSNGTQEMMKTRLFILAILLALAGCATGPNADPRDPLEPFNRGVMRFNDGIDAAVLKPVATAYVEGVPPLVRTGVSNFFGNLSDVWSFVNNVLQLRLQHAGETWIRLNVNTFFGLGGILDIASDLGIERHREDFGQTLGRWGVPSGPYLVLPFHGLIDRA
jgi:hypothetical protein